MNNCWLSRSFGDSFTKSIKPPMPHDVLLEPVESMPTSSFNDRMAVSGVKEYLALQPLSQHSRVFLV